MDTNETDRIKQEVNAYLIEPRSNVDIFHYWKINSEKWPRLTNLFRRFNSAPVGSQESERLFSTAGITLTDLRNRLTAENLEKFYVDQTVIEFLQRIRRLFDSAGTNVTIYTDDDQSRSWEIIRQNIWPFVNDNIRVVSFFSSQLERLRQFSPAILRNCANLRSIHSYDLFPVFPAEDNAEASSAQAVAKWLLTPRGDGLPKMLCYHPRMTKIEGFKGSFVSASEPVNFIIRLRSSSGIKPFELTNNWTGERLTLRRLTNKWLLVRCPIAREEDKWTNWEKEAIEWNCFSQWNRIVIDFGDSGFGGGIRCKRRSE